MTTLDESNIKGYNGNVNIKRKGMTIEFDQEMVTEFVKCAKDPTYFSEKYIKIVHVDHGLIPIKMYDYQKDIIEAITHNRRVTVNTSRQAGKTTTAVAVILHYVLFNDYKTVALLANKGDAAREILDRIKIAYEALPRWMQQGSLNGTKVPLNSRTDVRSLQVLLLLVLFEVSLSHFYTLTKQPLSRTGMNFLLQSSLRYHQVLQQRYFSPLHQMV